MSDVTDDSVLRAIAAAPAVRPPEPAPAPRPERRRWPIFVAIVVALAGFAGLCVLARAYVSVGTPIASWRLGAEPVALPNNLFDQFHFETASYTLETDVALPPELRGRELTISVPCFHAPLALAVDGERVADAGDLGAGEHHYVLVAAHTDRPQLHLALSARHDFESTLGFGVAPRIALASEADGFVAWFNRYTGLVAVVLAALLAFLYGIMYALDRRREYVVLVVGMIATMVVCLAMIDVIPHVSRLSGSLLTACGATMFITILTFQHFAFDLGPPPRWLVIPWGIIVVLAAASPAWFPLLIAAGAVMAVVGPATVIYVLVRAATITGRHRGEARLTLVWAVPQITSTFTEQYWRWSGVHLVGGLHLICLAICTIVLAQTTVLVLQFVARQRTIEHTSDELRRQVAERSKELADALARLADRPQASLVGKTLDGRYRVIAHLGAGGMGSVYEVERASDGQHFALKTLRDRVDAQVMARFAREAQFAAELRHPNLVPVIDVGIADGTLYLVMELVAAGALERERGKFGDPAWATPILAQIAAGLAAIHSRGLVHRDLKPANILLDRGVARIADFGLASLHVGALDDTTPHSPMLTRAGDVFGTPAYMAPELAAGASNAAPSADVFSFGVIAHELAAGRSPFAEPPVLARMHGRTAAPAIAELDPRLRELVAACLDLDPAKRPTADELVARLR